MQAPDFNISIRFAGLYIATVITVHFLCPSPLLVTPLVWHCGRRAYVSCFMFFILKNIFQRLLSDQLSQHMPSRSSQNLQGRTGAANSQSEISFSIPQATLSRSQFWIHRTVLLSFDHIRQTAVTYERSIAYGSLGTD